MKVTAALLTIWCAGVCIRSLADEPPASAPSAALESAATARPISVESDATPPTVEKIAAGGVKPTVPPAAVSPPTAPSAINPGVTVVGRKQDLTPGEQELVNRGYKLEVHSGAKYFCRREQQLGSRFEQKVCESAQSIEAHRADSQEAVRVLQSDRTLVNH